MRIKKIKIWGIIGLIFAFTFLFVGCSDDNNQTIKPKDETLNKTPKGKITLWVDPNYISTYQSLVKDFENDYPKVKVTVEGKKLTDVKNDVTKDPSKAADIFMTTSDQVPSLAEVGLLYPLRDRRVKDVNNDHSDVSIRGITWKHELYGYPASISAQVLYYDKTQINSNDLKSWSNLTTQGILAVKFNQTGANYIFAPQFISADKDRINTVFNDNSYGVNVLKWIKSQKNNRGILQSNEPLSDLKSGKAQSFIGSSDNANQVKEALNSKFAVAPMPSINTNQEKVPFKSLVEVKLFGVNQQSKYPFAAMTLAAFLTSKKSEVKVFHDLGLIPSNNKAQTDPNIKNDLVVRTTNVMSDNKHAVVLPNDFKTKKFWDSMDLLINDTYEGKINETDYLSRLHKIEKSSFKGREISR
ncbi:extracellular solute-binding protein [Xylocopilactobacillus apis]|uniref:Sugar ABC transporter substrate-binding protein n=1 Tax=Xylocopilactobacillus apis TaxID=2932183 RepID=A0AAU9CRV0_9LACO|nr:extracellular solute-binding protein [Xylocopilactobacillus apis]BDR56669.1 sugar ABC transporter substrate-binding protein [Xylocopilactobacillus apis]